jgi:transposase
VVGLSVITTRAVLRRWNDQGPAGLADRRQANGSKPRLSSAQRADLFAALKKRPPDGGLWTGPKVAAYVRDRWGVRVWPQTGWRWPRDLGFTLQVPRPRHPKSAGPAARRRWGKNLRRRLARLRRRRPGKRVEVWAEDEARLGLRPIARRVWSLKGQRPRSGAGPGTTGCTCTPSPGPGPGRRSRFSCRG